MVTMISASARYLLRRSSNGPALSKTTLKIFVPKQYAANSQHHRFMSSYPPHEVVGMPNLSPTMETGTIARWNLKEGDSFAAGDVFCEVETDKATVDFEAQDEGVLARILAEAGPNEIQCGEPIMIIMEEADDLDAFKDYTVLPTSTSTPPKQEVAPPAAPTPVTPPPVSAPSPPVTTSGGRAIASPLAHMLAKDMGFEVSAIPGTGPGGRILAADVKEYVPAPVTETAPATVPVKTPLAAPIPGAGYTDYPLATTAKEIAARLAASKQNVPHYYLTVDLQLDSLLAMRSRLNFAITASDDECPVLSLNDFLVKAAACAMKAVPSANASWMDSSVRVYDNVDINIAVGNGDALYTPLLKNVGGKGVKSISDDISAFVEAAESDEGLAAESCGMGTFTILNLGMYGIKSCAPIITEPQACALALGAAENRIIPSDEPDSEEIYKEAVMLTATMSLDHRVVDGAVGAQWLSAFKGYVENPESLLL